MTYQSDFHIHTLYLKCANETMTVPAILDGLRANGVKKFGISDHLNTRDKLPEHFKIKADLDALPERADGMECYFGVELNFLGCDGEFAYDEGVRDQAGFQYAIGGIHGTYIEEYDLTKLIDTQHRHHLLTCRNPLVDALVHPWWFGKGEFDNKGFPWFNDMSVVPEDLSRELGRVAAETGTAIEINSAAIFYCPNYSDRFKEQYVDYLALLNDEGPMFSLGSDAHSTNHFKGWHLAVEAAKRAGIAEERIWTPACEPLKVV